MIDFPATPTVGQVFTVGGQSWTWDGVKWLPTGLAGGPFVPLSGFVPAVNDNRIVNGDMRIDQRNASAGGTATNVYTCDRWQFVATQTAKFTWQRVSTLPAPGFPYCWGCTSQSAYALAAGDTFYVGQSIEADMVSDFAFGAAGAQPVTLSFLALSNQTGTFGGALNSGGGSSGRSYPFTYSIPVANIWTKIVITIPGDTAGTWTMKGNATGLIVIFDLGSGATFHAPAGAWATGNFVGANGAVSVVATNGASINLTGVKLEIGSVATPFNRQSLAKSMADCQRYYQAPTYMTVGGYSSASSTNYFTLPLITTMRVAPTVVLNSQAYTNTSGLAINLGKPEALSVGLATTAAGVGFVSFGFTASAEL